MIILAALVAWYLIGLLVCIIMMCNDIHQGRNVLLEDVGAAIGMSLFGPILIVVIIAMAISDNGDKVVVKGRRK